MKILVFLMALMLFSCTTTKEVTKQHVTKRGPSLKLQSSYLLFPGKVSFISFETHGLVDGAYEFKCPKRNIPFYVDDNVGKAYLVETYFSKLKAEECGFKDIAKFKLLKKEFAYKSEKLNVDKKRVFLNKKDLARVIKEREIKKKIYMNSQSSFQFDSAFELPLKSKITSYYGNKRLFNNKKQSQHLGNDLRAAVGVKIPSTNRGRVVYTGDLFYSGNIVVIDHGMEIFSVYGHLSKILVQEGDIVNKMDIVGLAGATGRVSGPHLHWGIRIQNQWVDGFSLIDESKKHFE